MIGNKQYLGDGVYVVYDGYGIVLTTEDGVSIQNTIYFEPELTVAFIAYAKRLHEFKIAYIKAEEEKKAKKEGQDG